MWWIRKTPTGSKPVYQEWFSPIFIHFPFPNCIFLFCSFPGTIIILWRFTATTTTTSSSCGWHYVLKGIYVQLTQKIFKSEWYQSYSSACLHVLSFNKMVSAGYWTHLDAIIWSCVILFSTAASDVLLELSTWPPRFFFYLRRINNRSLHFTACLRRALQEHSLYITRYYV